MKLNVREFYESVMKIQISLQLCTLYEDISTFIAHSDIQLLSSSEMVSCCYDSQGGINVMHTRARARTHTHTHTHTHKINVTCTLLILFTSGF